MGNKPLTWQQVLAALFGIAGFIFGIMAFGGNIPPETRPLGYLGLAISVPLFLAMLYLHWRSTHRADIYPDLLGQMAERKHLMEARGVHLFLQPIYLPGCEKLLVLAQNAWDGPASMDLSFSVNWRAPQVQPLRLDLPPAGIVAAVTDIPLAGVKARLATWDLSASVRTCGQRIRFRRYAALTGKVNPAFQLLALVGGTLIWGGGTTFQVAVPQETDSNLRTPPRTGWLAELVWTPDAPATIGEIESAVSHLIELHSEASAPARPQFPR